MKDLHDFPDAHLRIFDRPPAPNPEHIKRVYLIGICGTGMGSLAGLLHEAGYEVRGSDTSTYPPMSTRLADMGIEVIEGYASANIDPAPDLIVVGNSCVPMHPEAARARETGLTQLSLPEALAHLFIRDRRSLVVAGTHGKTTTTGMLVHLLQQSGEDPGFLVGGVMANGSRSYALGTGRHFVVEGDEYDSAYFDKKPKFMHYRPSGAAVTNMEFDHADIYGDWDDYRSAFWAFARSVSPQGLLALNGDDAHVRELATHTPARVRLFGISGPDLHVRASDLTTTSEGTRFLFEVDGNALGEMLLLMSGRHNVLNALAAVTIALDEGLPVTGVGAAFRSFQGIRRRQEIRAEIGGVTIIDDFAHHPTAVRETIASVRAKWPGHRLIAAFEPRSNSSRRKVFETQYQDAFMAADKVLISTPPFRHNDSPDNFMDAEKIAKTLTREGVQTGTYPDVDGIVERIADMARPGDIVLIMSNGAFGGIHDRLISELQERFAVTD